MAEKIKPQTKRVEKLHERIVGGAGEGVDRVDGYRGFRWLFHGKPR